MKNIIDFLFAISFLVVWGAGFMAYRALDKKNPKTKLITLAIVLLVIFIGLWPILSYRIYENITGISPLDMEPGSPY